MDAKPSSHHAGVVRVSNARRHRRAVACAQRNAGQDTTAMPASLTMGVWRRLIAILCVVSVCGSASGVLPAAVVLLGQFDGDHEVAVSSFGARVEVRFHHDEETPWDEAQRDRATHPERMGADSHDDHVVTFASLGDSVVPWRRRLPITTHRGSLCSPVGNGIRWRKMIGRSFMRDRRPVRRPRLVVCVR